MQILRFEDAQEVAPKRKKSSAGWIGLGLAAALFGVSTAFASSTIAINGGNTINLAQGVVAVTGCDSDIGVLPSTSLVKNSDTSALGFDVTGLTVGRFSFMLMVQHQPQRLAPKCLETTLPNQVPPPLD